MIAVTVLLILALAAGLVPLLQRDVRTAAARIEHRRLLANMTPLERALLQGFRSMGQALDRIALGMEAFGAAYRAAADEQDRRIIRKALRRGARRPRDRWSIR